MALISTRADGEYSVSETVGLSAYQRQTATRLIPVAAFFIADY